MSETSINYQPVDGASTAGLEDIFGVENSEGQVSPALVVVEAEDTPHQGWTVFEAARNLGVSEKTVLRRLQRGTLAGRKIAGQFGLEWRVYNTAQDSTIHTDSHGQPRTASVAVQDKTGLDIRDQAINELKNELTALRNQLEGAIYRNGYLEAKLEERDTTIKLLTDSQHGLTWWRRVRSWFIGKRP